MLLRPGTRLAAETALNRREARAIDAALRTRRSRIRAAVIFSVLVGVLVYATQPMFGGGGTGVVDASKERLQADVVRISTGFGPRDCEHPEVLEKVAQFIHGELASCGGRVADQYFDADGRRYVNVVASFGSESPERLVVGAHYDTRGPLPGADDNASGVAGLLEVGRMLGKTTLETRIDLVAYSLEEPPYFRTPSMGSAVHARALRQDGVQVRAMLCLEMIGCFSDASGSQSFPVPLVGLLYPSVGNFVAVVGNVGGALLVRRVKSAMRRATELPVRSLNAPSFLAGVDFSDHLNYWKAGFPAVMVTDTAFCRNKNYHTEHDTADLLDYVRMSKVVQGVYDAVVDLAR